MSAVNDLRTDVATEIGVLRPQVEELTEATASATSASHALRGELSAELAALRERMASTTAASTEAVRAALVETRDEVAEGQRGLREALLDRLQEQHVAVTERLGALGGEVTSGAGATREAGERLAALGSASEEVRRGLEALTAGTVEKVRTDEAALTELRASLAATTTEQLAALAEATRERLEVLEQAQEALRRPSRPTAPPGSRRSARP